MLRVCGTSLILPGWLVLGVTVGTGNIQTLKPDTRQSCLRSCRTCCALRMKTCKSGRATQACLLLECTKQKSRAWKSACIFCSWGRGTGSSTHPPSHLPTVFDSDCCIHFVVKAVLLNCLEAAGILLAVSLIRLPCVCFLSCV